MSRKPKKRRRNKNKKNDKNLNSGAKTPDKGLHEMWQIRELNKLYLENNFHQMKENANLNKDRINSEKSINDLIKEKNSFKDKICSVCAPGPSIAYEMENIQKHKDDMTIIAIDSVLFPLKLIGVYPDFVFFKNIDEKTIKLLENYPTEKSKFILPVCVNPELLEIIKGEIYFYVPYDDIKDISLWSKKFKNIERILLKSSTASMAYLFADKLDFDSIILCGFDFAFTDGKLYCDLVKYFSCEHYITEYSKGDNEFTHAVEANSIFIEKTYTNYPLHMSAEDLFRIIFKKTFTKTFNSSSGILYNINWISLKFLFHDKFKESKSNANLKILFGNDEQTININKRTTNYMMPLSARNALYNFDNNLVNYSINKLFDKKEFFKDKTAIIAGAAPSLDNCLDDLKNNRDKYFLFCVDAALNPLLQAGIQPDFCLTIDPQTHNAKFLRDLPTEDIILISTINTHPESILTWKGDILFSWTITYSPHIFRLTQFFPDLGAILPLGNVGATLVSLCKDLQFQNVIFTGIDFAYTNDQYYCKNVLKEDLQNIRDREHLIDIMTNVSGKVIIEKKDIFGNTVITDNQLNAYAEFFPHFIKNNYGLNHGIKNAGAGIMDFFEHVKLDEFFSEN